MSQVTQSFVGVDLHKCTVTLTAVDVGGEIQRLKISTKSTGKIEAWLRALPGPVWMAVEACPFVEWFIDRFRSCVDRIDIAEVVFRTVPNSHEYSDLPGATTLRVQSEQDCGRRAGH
jgi:hypothetical protein